MTTFRPRLWTGVSAAVLASTLALSGCGGGEGGEAAAGGTGAPAAVGESGAEGGQPAAAPAGEGGEGGSEGAGGEAGAAGAYGAVDPASRDALRLAHLRGFFLAAREQSGADATVAAQALVGQGLLEVYDPSKVEFTRLGLDETRLRRAAQTGAPADIDAAVVMINEARGRAGGAAAAVVTGMTEIATGLYRETVVDGVIDPTEYQHSRGAALSARAELNRGATPAVAGARTDIDRFVALWPGEDAPEDAARAATPQQVQLQASRIQLALSGA